VERTAFEASSEETLTGNPALPVIPGRPRPLGAAALAVTQRPSGPRREGRRTAELRSRDRAWAELGVLRHWQPAGTPPVGAGRQTTALET
jgi:hypothetical protein